MYSVSLAGVLLGGCAQTIRRWEKEGKIQWIRTIGGLEESVMKR
jgi:hypothetical protein